MKKVLLLLAALIGITYAATAQETVTISFSNLWTSNVTSPTYNGDIISFTTAKNNGTNATAFFSSDSSIRLYKASSGSNGGQISITANTGVTLSKVEYTTSTAQTSWTSASVTNNSCIIKNTTTSTLKIYALRVTYTKDSQGGDETAVPELPVVTFNGTTAVNGESYEVAAGTTVNVSSKNATTVYVNGTAKNSFVVDEAGSYTIYGENANGKSAEFTVSFTIKQNTPVVPSTSTTYQRITSPSDLEIDAKYIIVCEDKNKAIGNAVSSNLDATNVTIVDHTTTISDDVLVFVLGSKDGGYTLKYDNYKGTGSYMAVGSSGAGIQKGSNPGICNITFSNGNAKITFTNSTTRQISFGGSDFRYYATSNVPSSYPYVQLYKQVASNDPIDFEPEIGAVPALYPEDKHQIVIANEAKPATFTFESKNPEIATVSETGEITAVAEGTATITISWEGDKTWNAGSKDITVEVKKALADPGLWFRHPEVHGKINVGVVAQAVHHKSPGKITYSSSNPAVAVVDPNTGMIIPANVKSVGHTTITANIEATEEYRSGSLSYELYIEEPDFGSTAPAGEKMFDFTAANPEGYGMFDFTTTYFSNDHTYYERNINEKEGEQYASHVPVMTIKDVDPVTLSFDGDVRRWNGKELRVYFKAKMTFSVPAGYSIEKITLNSNSPKKFKAESGTYSNGTWTADSEGCTSVTFLQDDMSSHAAVYTITVVLKKAESDRTLADLNFETRTYNTYAGELTTVNAVKTPNLEDLRDLIVYSIDNLETGFVIDAVDDNTLNVTVDEPGVYTLRARTSATDKYLRGVAILRLNVFPKVKLEHNAEELTDGLMIVPAEGGKVKFGELPSTVALMVKRNGDAEFKAHDGSELTFADDDNLEYYMEYAETYRHGESKLEVVVRPTVPTHDEATGTHTFAPSKGAMLYHTALTVENMAKMMAPAADGTEWTKLATDDVLNVNPADYNLTDGQRLAFKAKSVKVASDGTEVAGPEKRFAILSNGQLSGVEDVEIEAEGAVRFYNLNGVEVDAADMAPGMYIRRSGSKAEKVVIK